MSDRPPVILNFTGPRLMESTDKGMWCAICAALYLSDISSDPATIEYVRKAVDDIRIQGARENTTDLTVDIDLHMFQKAATWRRLNDFNRAVTIGMSTHGMVCAVCWAHLQPMTMTVQEETNDA